MGSELICGDALTQLRTFDDSVFDALVTDPPAGIGFMGRDWDAFRRTHNAADVGRDNVFGRTSAHASHSYGESDRGRFLAAMTPVFAEALRTLKPGAHAVVWALPRTSHWTATALEDAGYEIRDRLAHIFGTGFPKALNLDGEYAGWSTTLKPAVEDWWLCRKPLSEPTVAANLARWGTGALNVDATRVPPAGRWPTHLVFSHSIWCREEGCAPECPVAELDDQSGILTSGHMLAGTVRGSERFRSTYSAYSGGPTVHDTYADSGGASRFFPTFRYTAKARGKDRSAGLPPDMRNTHPTVKPLALMDWLIRLVTPAGGTVLDPFAGSGSTLLAAKQGGWHYVGIEREAEYVRIAQARVAAA